MSVKLLSNTINILVGLLKAAVEARTQKLNAHADKSEVLLRKQRREFEIARKNLELAQAATAIKLYKSLDEAQKALDGISK